MLTKRLPSQEPVPPSVLQPGQLQPELWHEAQERYEGVPVQLGTWNSVGAGGKAPVVPQQMRAWPTVQSLSEEHAFGQVAEQMSPQQSGVFSEPAQSESVVHPFGHDVACRQSDCAAMVRLGSSLPTVLQQISPEAVSQSVFCVHVAGQLFSAVQIGVE